MSLFAEIEQRLSCKKFAQFLFVVEGETVLVMVLVCAVSVISLTEGEEVIVEDTVNVDPLGVPVPLVCVSVEDVAGTDDEVTTGSEVVFPVVLLGVPVPPVWVSVEDVPWVGVEENGGAGVVCCFSVVPEVKPVSSVALELMVGGGYLVDGTRVVDSVVL